MSGLHREAGVMLQDDRVSMMPVNQLLMPLARQCDFYCQCCWQNLQQDQLSLR